MKIGCWMVWAGWCACAREPRDDGPTNLRPPPAIPPTPATVSKPRSPPPPPPPSAQDPPKPVIDFLAACAQRGASWTARVERRALSVSQANALALRLGERSSYVDGDSGCVTTPVHYELMCGDLRFEFVENCSHMQIGNDDHAAIFSSEMAAFLGTIRN